MRLSLSIALVALAYAGHVSAGVCCIFCDEAGARSSVERSLRGYIDTDTGDLASRAVLSERDCCCEGVGGCRLCFPGLQ